MEGPELNPELLLSLLQVCGTVKSWDRVFKKTTAQYLWRCEFKFRQGPAIAFQLLHRRMLKNTKITLSEEETTSFLQDIHVIEKDQFMDCARKLEELIRLKSNETNDEPKFHPPFTSAQEISSCDPTLPSGMDSVPINDSDQYDRHLEQYDPDTFTRALQYPLSPLNPLEMNTGEYGSFVSSDLQLSHIIKRKSSPFMEHRRPSSPKRRRETPQIEPISQHPQKEPDSSSKVPRTKEELFSFQIPWDHIDNNAILNGHIDDWLFGRVADLMGEPDSILQDFILKNLQSHVTPSDLERRLALVLEDSKIAGDLVMELWKLLVTESLESPPITTAPTPPSAPATKPTETESVVTTVTKPLEEQLPAVPESPPPTPPETPLTIQPTSLLETTIKIVTATAPTLPPALTPATTAEPVEQQPQQHPTDSQNQCHSAGPESPSHTRHTVNHHTQVDNKHNQVPLTATNHHKTTDSPKPPSCDDSPFHS
ncbi:hypothetical protein Pelo_5411 [Pelomyxa schiedti]|nr:hypothetical protein Pelo_5411 [Pelomyxa schiedti]